jgi:hypothetical protein
MLQLREDSGNVVFELQTALLEPFEHFVSRRLFLGFDEIDLAVHLVIAFREPP